jgi:hypothetical protein
MKAGQANAKVVGMATADGGQTWDCTAANTITTVDIKWLPQACK